MTGPAYEGCAQIRYPGARCMLGQLRDGRYAIWGVAGGQPLVTWAFTPEGWTAAWGQYAAWEQIAPPSTSSSAAPVWIGLTIAVVILAVIYVVFHENRYGDCVIEPGLFSWPSSCI